MSDLDKVLKDIKREAHASGHPWSEWVGCAVEELAAERAEHERQVAELRRELDLALTLGVRLEKAVMSHHADRNGDRCHERDNELYAVLGLEPLKRPENYPIEQHRRECDSYRAGLYGVPVEGEPCAQVAELRAMVDRVSFADAVEFDRLEAAAQAVVRAWMMDDFRMGTLYDAVHALRAILNTDTERPADGDEAKK